MTFGGKIAGVINWALDRNISADRSFLVNDLAGRRQGPVPLVLAASPQTVTLVAPRAPLIIMGSELAVDGFTRATLWARLDIGVMTGIRFACYGRHTTGGTSYQLPIYNPSVGGVPYQILFTGEEVRYADDGNDINIALTWDIKNTFPCIWFGVGATADPGGGDDASILEAHVTYGWGS